LPSLNDAFPYSVLEAMAMGKPVIAARVGAIPEMIGIGQTDQFDICVKLGNKQELFFEELM